MRHGLKQVQDRAIWKWGLRGLLVVNIALAALLLGGVLITQGLAQEDLGQSHVTGRPDSLFVGEQATFEIAIINSSPVTAENVLLYNPIPPRTRFVAVEGGFPISGTLNAVARRRLIAGNRPAVAPSGVSVDAVAWVGDVPPESTVTVALTITVTGFDLSSGLRVTDTASIYYAGSALVRQASVAVSIYRSYLPVTLRAYTPPLPPPTCVELNTLSAYGNPGGDAWLALAPSRSDVLAFQNVFYLVRFGGLIKVQEQDGTHAIARSYTVYDTASLGLSASQVVSASIQAEGLNSYLTHTQTINLHRGWWGAPVAAQAAMTADRWLSFDPQPFYSFQWTKPTTLTIPVPLSVLNMDGYTNILWRGNEDEPVWTWPDHGTILIPNYAADQLHPVRLEVCYRQD